MDPSDGSKITYLLYLLYALYIFEKPTKDFYQDIQKAAAISFFLLLFVMSTFLIIVYFTNIGYAFIETAFWIVSTSMTALLMVSYGWIKDDRKRNNRKQHQNNNPHT
jgi:hypothetical protein